MPPSPVVFGAECCQARAGYRDPGRNPACNRAAYGTRQAYAAGDLPPSRSQDSFSQKTRPPRLPAHSGACAEKKISRSHTDATEQLRGSGEILRANLLTRPAKARPVGVRCAGRESAGAAV